MTDPSPPAATTDPDRDDEATEPPVDLAAPVAGAEGAEATPEVGPEAEPAVVADLEPAPEAPTDDVDAARAAAGIAPQPEGDAAPAPATAEPEPAAEEPEPAAAEPEPRANQPEPAAAEPEPRANQPEPSADEWEPPADEPAAATPEVGPEAEPAVVAELEAPADGAGDEVVAPRAAAGLVPPPGGDETGPGAEPPAPSLPPPPPGLADVPADAGSIVAGTVREIRGDDVIVDLEDGRTGVINRRNLGAEGGPESVVTVGERVEGAVLARTDPEHRVVLSRSWARKKRAWEAIAQAAEEHQTLTGRVVSVGQKGVVVDVGVRGFVPGSHLELGPVADLQGYAGQELALRVLDVDVEKERLVLSRRTLLLKEQRRSVHDVLSALQPGEVRRGTVTSLSDYGAFVDLGGVNGLVHLSELSWQRVRHPSDVLSVGQEVEVRVLDVKVKKRRVSLSIRQLTDDPLAGLEPGGIHTGPVTRLVDFGAFVDVSGVEGLVHLSELAEYRVSAPEEVVAPGEQVRVKVLSVDRKRRRVELSIRQAAEYGG